MGTADVVGVAVALDDIDNNGGGGGRVLGVAVALMVRSGLSTYVNDYFVVAKTAHVCQVVRKFQLKISIFSLKVFAL